MKPAKICYDHIGGKLGTLLLEMCIQQEWIMHSNSTGKHYFITDKGQIEFTKMGLDLSLIKDETL
jgi:hypothetical protein